MRRIRLIIDEGPGDFQMAMDEALLILRGLNISPDTLRLYVFRPSAVTIGYFQSVSDSVNLEYVNSEKIPVVRRITGGGSVFHDSYGEITYSVILRETEVPKGTVESFRFLGSGVILAARALGADAMFVPLNDGVIEGKKFSGHAQARKLGAVLQHGTFMYSTDLDKLSRCLKAPNVKFTDKTVSTIRERVTTVSEAIGRKVTKDEALRALIDGFSKALNAELVRGTYTKEELTLANSLKWKYRSTEWTFMRP